jgi:hypothetical protein
LKDKLIEHKKKDLEGEQEEGRTEGESEESARNMKVEDTYDDEGG